MLYMLQSNTGTPGKYPLKPKPWEQKRMLHDGIIPTKMPLRNPSPPYSTFVSAASLAFCLRRLWSTKPDATTAFLSQLFSGMLNGARLVSTRYRNSQHLAGPPRRDGEEREEKKTHLEIVSATARSRTMSPATKPRKTGTPAGTPASHTAKHPDTTVATSKRCAKHRTPASRGSTTPRSP